MSDLSPEEFPAWYSDEQIAKLGHLEEDGSMTPPEPLDRNGNVGADGSGNDPEFAQGKAREDLKEEYFNGGDLYGSGN
jgi:hypothetical protein